MQEEPSQSKKALLFFSFLFLFLFLHWNPAVAAVLSVLLYFAFGLLLKPRKKLGGIDIEKIQGGEELQRLLDEARKDLKQIGKAARAITNIKAREDAEALESCGKRILAYLQENPEKISMARRFFTYYLDTAAGLLERYIQMQRPRRTCCVLHLWKLPMHEDLNLAAFVFVCEVDTLQATKDVKNNGEG